MFEAVLVGPYPNCPLLTIIKKYNASMKTLSLKVLEKSREVQELFEIFVKPELVNEMVEGIHRSQGLSHAEITRYRDGHLYGSIRIGSKPICRVFLESNCFLTSIRTIDRMVEWTAQLGGGGTPEGQRGGDGMVEWTVRGPSDAFQELMRRIEAEGYEVRVKRISNFRDERALTARQEAILDMALERGYFDFPRKINLHRLAEEVGVKPATVLEILRRAQRKVLSGYLRGIRHLA